MMEIFARKNLMFKTFSVAIAICPTCNKRDQTHLICFESTLIHNLFVVLHIKVLFT